MIGRFIGLRGCDSPVRVKTEEDFREEVRKARERDEEERAMIKAKMGWY
jgi:hypothetical protein